MTLYHEKADQAQALLAECGLACWLTFVRETAVTPDPGVEMVVGADFTWPSAFLIDQSGARVAIVGRYDAMNLRDGPFTEIIPYDQGIGEHLRAVLARLDPATIGLNYSVDDKTSDGLTHGMWLMLGELLRDTPYAARLTSAGPLLTKLRARKTASEVDRIRAAVATTEEIVSKLGAEIRVGRSEAEIAAFVHNEFRARGLPSAWAWDACPIVNAGAESEPGHGKPRADLHVAPGQIVHIDLGVQQEGYCSDMQRLWYVLRPEETAPPPDVQRAFDVVRQAITAAADALKPGVVAHSIDDIAREVVVDAGYPEYMHAVGHGLGRACHDGGPLLGPRWERYGNTPMMTVEAGNVYTLELGVQTSAGYVGLEEDVLVTEDGCVFLSAPQTELMLLRA